MKNITVKEYIELNVKERFIYDSLLNNINAKEVVKIDFDTISWDNVKKIIKLLSKVDSFDVVCDIFKLAFNMTSESFYNLPIVNYFQIKKFLIKKFVYLHENEVKLLSSSSNDIGLWQMAGGNKLDFYSENLPLSQLAKIYGGYPFDYGKKPYNEILYLLKMNQTQNEVENKFQELKSKQK